MHDRAPDGRPIFIAPRPWCEALEMRGWPPVKW